MAFSSKSGMHPLLYFRARTISPFLSTLPSSESRTFLWKLLCRSEHSLAFGSHLHGPNQRPYTSKESNSRAGPKSHTSESKMHEALQILSVIVISFPAFIACRFLDRSHSDWREMVPHRVSFLTYTSTLFQRRQWHPTPVLLPGLSHGRRSLVGCSPWGC